MTLDVDPAGSLVDQPNQKEPVDPRPAWERVAHTWLEREVDGGHPVDPAALAAEVSVAPRLARDLVRVLRVERDHDPTFSELRGRLVRDRIADAYLRRELAGGSRLDPAELAAEVGTSPAVVRQWLAGLRAQHPSGQSLEILGEPVSHGRPTAGQLARLQAISPPMATSRPPSAAAPLIRSGSPPRWNATTGPARSALVSGCVLTSSPAS